MAATDQGARFTRAILAGVVILALFLIACAVDLATSTPGAAGVCEPSAGGQSDFKTRVFDPMVSVDCARCHSPGTTNQNGGFVMDSNNMKQNYCLALRLGQRLVTHPQDPKHGGGVALFPGPELTSMQGWVNSPVP